MDIGEEEKETIVVEPAVDPVPPAQPEHTPDVEIPVEAPELVPA